jgi:hypothetical protein
MIREPIHLKRAVLSVAVGCLLAATPVLAAPGDPLGGDDTGCAPNTLLGLTCARKVDRELGKLKARVVKCHLTQATAAFKTGMSTPGFSNAEENCEIGPSNTSAKAKFDSKMAALAGNGCDATVLANANAARDIILGDESVVGSMDNLNATFFCDATSGNEIDPGGDDGGWIPATSANLKCSITVAKSWAKLAGSSTVKCHEKLALYTFKGAFFDEELCEDTGGKSALDKYNLKVNKAIAYNLCPPCVTDPGPTNALALGTSAVADSDADLQDVYICPGP